MVKKNVLIDFGIDFSTQSMLKSHTSITKELIIFSHPNISERNILICMNSVWGRNWLLKNPSLKCQDCPTTKESKLCWCSNLNKWEYQQRRRIIDIAMPKNRKNPQNFKQLASRLVWVQVNTIIVPYTIVQFAFSNLRYNTIVQLLWYKLVPFLNRRSRYYAEKTPIS